MRSRLNDEKRLKIFKNINLWLWNRGYPVFDCKMKFLLAKKIKMSQVFKKDGTVVPVTLVEAGPCRVTQLKSASKDGYDAVQMEFDGWRGERRGQGELKVGDEVGPSLFEKGDKVHVSGLSKGKGFAGGVKRHGFVDKAKAHGAKDMRRVGSTGGRYPQRTIKGRRMPGRMGHDMVTVKNLEIVDMDDNILALKGAVPGRRGTRLKIREA